MYTNMGPFAHSLIDTIYYQEDIGVAFNFNHQIVFINPDFHANASILYFPDLYPNMIWEPIGLYLQHPHIFLDRPIVDTTALISSIHYLYNESGKRVTIHIRWKQKMLDRYLRDGLKLLDPCMYQIIRHHDSASIVSFKVKDAFFARGVHNYPVKGDPKSDELFLNVHMNSKITGYSFTETNRGVSL